MAGRAPELHRTATRTTETEPKGTRGDGQPGVVASGGVAGAGAASAIPVVCHVRPELSGENPQGFLDWNHRVLSSGSASCNFGAVYRKAKPLFHSVVDPLALSFTRGYNVALHTLGETQSGRSHLLFDPETGAVRRLLGKVFQHLPQKAKVRMSVVELYSEVARDLIQTNDQAQPRLVETPQSGYSFRNVSEIEVQTVQDAELLLSSALSARETDIRKTKHCSCIVQLQLRHGGVVAQCCIVELPSVSTLTVNPTRVRLMEGPNVLKSILAYNRLVLTLASADVATVPGAHQVYQAARESLLTRYLVDTLVGNFQTALIATLKPYSTTSLIPLIKLCAATQRIRVVQLQSTPKQQQLEARYRARYLAETSTQTTIMAQLKFVSSTSQSLEDKLTEVNLELLQTKVTNSKLVERLAQAKDELSKLKQARLNLIRGLVESDEDRLNLSRSLVELQLDFNQLHRKQKEDESSQTAQTKHLEDQVKRLKQQLANASSQQPQPQSVVQKVQPQKPVIKQGISREIALQILASVSQIVKDNVELVKERNQLAQQVIATSGQHTGTQADLAFAKASAETVFEIQNQEKKIRGIVEGLIHKGRGAMGDDEEDGDQVASVLSAQKLQQSGQQADQAYVRGLEQERAALLADKASLEQQLETLRAFIKTKLAGQSVRTSTSQSKS
eukprot:m.351526 g.351526  ORF g.351526 m.351526 type:complete len:675 (+) comp16270_c0_seq1:101-2125(+)